jgi:hypothetical protein
MACDGCVFCQDPCEQSRGCDYCGADVGEPCRPINGVTPYGGVHMARVVDTSGGRDDDGIFDEEIGGLGIALTLFGCFTISALFLCWVAWLICRALT